MTQESHAPDGHEVVRQNYEALNQARDHLHQALERNPKGCEPEWLRGIKSGVAAVSGALKTHQRLSEDEHGILQELTGKKPSLLVESNRLEREHTEMLLRASEIEEAIEQQLAFEEYRVELVRLEAAVLHDMFHLHIVRADWLTYDAYNREEGGEGG